MTAVLFALGLVVCLTTVAARTSYVQLAGDALADGDFPAACSFADQALEIRPGDVRSIFIGAEAAEQNGDLQRAVDFLKRLPAAIQDYDVHSGRLKLADLQSRLGQFTPARGTYETILEQTTDDSTACRRLAALLSGCGYRFDALPLLRRLVATNEANSADLVRLALNGTMLFGQPQLERAHELCPDDPMPIVGLIEHENNDRDVVARKSLMRDAESLASASIPLQIQVLEFQMETVSNEGSGILDVQAELLELLSAAPGNPETWRLSALWAQQKRLPQMRLRCLLESAIRDPWNVACMHALSEALRRESAADDEAAELARHLRTLQESAQRFYAGSDATPDVEQLATSLQSIGRGPEAKAWARIALRADSSLRWARLLVSDSASMMHGESAQMSRDSRKETYRQLAAELPLPHEFLTREAAAVWPGQSAIRFVDASSSVGIRFLYDNGVVSGQEGLRMHQWTGGGAGVIDIDADSWPDLYFSQGAEDKDNGRSEGASGALYRNLRGNVFDDVSRQARV
ncbi:MAG: hypothetical protein P8J37_23250, partial [Fuerstiella sp.]|nr:hypothetical protein [Fuerstiella sp.]